MCEQPSLQTPAELTGLAMGAVLDKTAPDISPEGFPGFTTSEQQQAARAAEPPHIAEATRGNDFTPLLGSKPAQATPRKIASNLEIPRMSRRQ